MEGTGDDAFFKEEGDSAADVLDIVISMKKCDFNEFMENYDKDFR